MSAIQSGHSCSSISPLPFSAIIQSEEAIGCLYCRGQVDIDSLDPVDTGSAVTCSTHSHEEVARAIKAMVTQVDVCRSSKVQHVVV